MQVRSIEFSQATTALHLPCNTDVYVDLDLIQHQRPRLSWRPLFVGEKIELMSNFHSYSGSTFLVLLMIMQMHHFPYDLS